MEVAKVPHKPGSAVVPALSPDGKKIAYNAMPELGIDSSRDAETYILDLELGEMTLVAQRVDLLTVPRSVLPEVRSSAGQFGVTDGDVFGAEVPITGIAGDQRRSIRAAGGERYRDFLGVRDDVLVG